MGGPISVNDNLPWIGPALALDPAGGIEQYARIGALSGCAIDVKGTGRNRKQKPGQGNRVG